jgi:hypothetical protein
MDQIVTKCVKVENLKVNKTKAKQGLWCATKTFWKVATKHKIEYEMAFQQLSEVESWIHLIQNRLQRMEIGWGLSLYPFPSMDNLEFGVELDYSLNVCLVCGFWYKCHDHMTTPCGHTYHPWCMFQHSTHGDLKCLLLSLSYEVEFFL